MREVETARPNPSWDIWWFWQKRQRSGQPVKKIAPEPASPEMGGSSQKWSAALATRGVAVAPQTPALPWERAAPQRRGHSSQTS